MPSPPAGAWPPWSPFMEGYENSGNPVTLKCREIAELVEKERYSFKSTQNAAADMAKKSEQAIDSVEKFAWDNRNKGLMINLESDLWELASVIDKEQGRENQKGTYRYMIEQHEWVDPVSWFYLDVMPFENRLPDAGTLGVVEGLVRALEERNKGWKQTCEALETIHIKQLTELKEQGPLAD